MDINEMIGRIKRHPDAAGIGMIASHMGVVRGSSLNGEEVTAIDVVYDKDVIKDIVEDIKSLPGITEVLVEIHEGRLKVGDDILAVAVGGNIRDNVFPALIKTVNRIKAEAVKKKEFF